MLSLTQMQRGTPILLKLQEFTVCLLVLLTAAQMAGTAEGENACFQARKAKKKYPGFGWKELGGCGDKNNKDYLIETMVAITDKKICKVYFRLAL